MTELAWLLVFLLAAGGPTGPVALPAGAWLPLPHPNPLHVATAILVAQHHAREGWSQGCPVE